jgi:hypothetical protein
VYHYKKSTINMHISEEEAAFLTRMLNKLNSSLPEENKQLVRPLSKKEAREQNVENHLLKISRKK